MSRMQYALAGIAYALAGIDEAFLTRIRAAYLFGSVAQGSAAAESDVDVFFDVEMTGRQLAAFNRQVRRLFEGFRLTQTGLRFKMDGVANIFSPIAGKLSAWPELLRSIAVSGMQVYGPARLQVTGESWMVYSWEKLKNRGAFLNAVYGFKVKKKYYPGFLKRANGFRIGKSAVAIPRTDSSTFESLLKKYNASYTTLEFFR